MLGPILCIILVCLLVAGECKWGVVSGEWHRAVKAAKPPEAVEAKPDYPEPHVMSWIGRQVMKKFNELPDSHKPSWDVRAAVVALDVKYMIAALDSHFDKRWDLNWNGPECNCESDSGFRVDVCEYYPEFYALWHSMMEIKSALYDLKRAEEDRARQIELAGIENDLSSVDDIVAAFKSEASILRETAKEISA